MTTSPESFSNAWLLHQKPQGDTSLQLTWFTLESGVLRCTYRGARRMKKRHALQLFTPYWLSLEPWKEWYYVKQMESQALAADLQGNALVLGLYLNELIFHSLYPLDAHPLVHQAYSCALNEWVLANDALSMERALRRFEMALLASCGYALDFSHEAETGLPIDPHAVYQFQPQRGFVRTSQGLLGTTLLDFIAEPVPSQAVMRALKPVFRQAIDALLQGKPLNSRALWIPLS